MSRLPQVSGKETIRALTKVGFVKVSQKGSHIKLVRISGKNKVTLTVPDHKNTEKRNSKKWNSESNTVNC